MFKFDQTTDFSGKELFSFLQGVEIPEFVKSAELGTLEQPVMVKEAYADQGFKAYPVDNPANTYLSFVHFFNKKAAVKEMYGKGHANRIDENIKRAAQIFGIEDQLHTYAVSRSALLNKTAASHDIGFVKVGNHELATYEYTTAADLTKVAEQFSDDTDLFDFASRRSIAQELVKAAGENDLDELPDLVVKYAGLGFPDRVLVQGEITRRLDKFASADDRAELLKIGEKLVLSATVSDYLDAAGELHCLETKAGLRFNEKTSAVLGDFVGITMLTAEKVAEILADEVMLGKTAFSKQQLETVPADLFKQAFGLDIDPAALDKHRDDLAIMPASDVDLFRQLAGL